MILRNASGFRTATWMVLGRNWPVVVFVVSVEALSVQLHKHVPALDSTALSEGSVAVLAGAVAVFLAFRFNEAYGRWWEARTLWGGVVNASRTFARQVTTYATPAVLQQRGGEASAHQLHRELVYRQIAYVHALRLGLRRHRDFEALRPLLPPAELEAARSVANIPNYLLQRQSDRLTELLPPDANGQLITVRIDSTLTELTNMQGGLERIKNTVFPDRVTLATRVWVWLISVLFALAFIDPDDSIRVLELLAVLMVVLSFQLVSQLGEELTDPFENRPNDTPMTAICRTIEIDLRQQLGETDVPEPLQGVNGVLM